MHLFPLKVHYFIAYFFQTNLFWFCHLFVFSVDYRHFCIPLKSVVSALPFSWCHFHRATNIIIKRLKIEYASVLPNYPPRCLRIRLLYWMIALSQLSHHFFFALNAFQNSILIFSSRLSRLIFNFVYTTYARISCSGCMLALRNSSPLLYYAWSVDL